MTRREWIGRVGSLTLALCPVPLQARKNRSEFEKFLFAFQNASVTSASVSPSIAEQLWKWALGEHYQQYALRQMEEDDWTLVASVEVDGRVARVIHRWEGTEKWTVHIGGAK